MGSMSFITRGSNQKVDNFLLEKMSVENWIFKHHPIGMTVKYPKVSLFRQIDDVVNRIVFALE